MRLANVAKLGFSSSFGLQSEKGNKNYGVEDQAQICDPCMELKELTVSPQNSGEEP